MSYNSQVLSCPIVLTKQNKTKRKKGKIKGKRKMKRGSDGGTNLGAFAFFLFTLTTLISKSYLQSFNKLNLCKNNIFYINLDIIAICN